MGHFSSRLQIRRVLLFLALGTIAFCAGWIISMAFEVYRPIRVYPEEVLPRGDAL